MNTPRMSRGIGCILLGISCASANGAESCRTNASCTNTQIASPQKSSEIPDAEDEVADDRWPIPDGTLQEVLDIYNEWTSATWWKDVSLHFYSNEALVESHPAYQKTKDLTRHHVPALMFVARQYEDPAVDPPLERLTGIKIRATSVDFYDPIKGDQQVAKLWVNWWLKHKDDPEWRDLR